MPGYEPFLLCDFHVHTQWSDGKLSVAEVIDLYGSTGKFDVIAITDHILMKNDLLARAGRLATLGRRAFGVRETDFDAYLDDIRTQAERALQQYNMLVDPRRRDHAEPAARQEELAHHRPRHREVRQRRSVRQRHPQGDPPTGRSEHRLPSASPDDPADRDQHVLSVGPPRRAVGSRRRVGGRRIATTCSR